MSDSAKTQPTIPHYEDRPVTLEEFIKHVGLDSVPDPLPIRTVCEVKGNYGVAFSACICGQDLRTGGWYYTARKATPRGCETISFPERDIIQVVTK